MTQPPITSKLNIASFETGRMWERLDIIDFIQNEWTEYPDVDWLIERLIKRS